MFQKQKENGVLIRMSIGTKRGIILFFVYRINYNLEF